MLHACLALARNLLTIALFPLLWARRRLRRPRESWVHLRLRSRVVEFARPLPGIARLVPSLSAPRPTTLGALRRFTDLAVADRAIEGVLLEVPVLMTGWATLEAVRALVGRLRAAGKQVVVWLPEGGGNRELFLASAADRILASPRATLSPLGVAATTQHLKGLLDKVHVAVEVHRRAEFKTAAESLTDGAMSAPQRVQLDALLDTVDGALVAALAARKGMSEAKVRALFEKGFWPASDALAEGWLDGVCYEDGLGRAISGEGRDPVRLVRASRYVRVVGRPWFVPVGRRPYIAVVPVHGPIVHGPGGAGPGRAPTAGCEALTSTLRALARDRRAVGVVLHVDSPGGSALGSDQVHREVSRLAEGKPVVACFGEVSASGGYYVAAPAHAIVAQRLTVTGSIGVIAARFVVSDLLARVGVTTEVLRRAPHADLLQNPRPMDPGEHALVAHEIDAFYRAFIDVVAAGRRLSVEVIEPLARGRVWSGADAHTHGLVDRLGGLDVALDLVRERLTTLPRRVVVGLEAEERWPHAADESPIALGPASPRGGLLEGLGMRLAPRVAELAALLEERDRVLFYAVDLPEIG